MDMVKCYALVTAITARAATLLGYEVWRIAVVNLTTTIRV